MQDIVGLYRHLRCWALLGWVAIFVQAENAQQSLSRDEAIDEIVADASMDRMGDKSFWQAVAENLGEDRAEVRGKIAQFFDKYLGKIKEALRTKQVFMSRVNVARLEKQMQDALSALYAEGIREAAKNRKALTGTATETKNAATEGGEVQYSVRTIVGQSGKIYGTGVYLDSTLLDGLADTERKEMIREYVKEIGGQVFTAYNPTGTAVNVKIAEYQRKFRNQGGTVVRVNRDLITKNTNNKVKQEAVVLVDELLKTANYDSQNAARYTHDWLDNNGQNDWQKWTTYLQDKSNTVWLATLHIAEAADGTLYLYDIDPIKKVERGGKSPQTPQQQNAAGTKIQQAPANVKPGDQKSSRPSDTAYLEAVERGDLETAQKMVDEAAKRAGYPIKAWHGTPIKGITSFDLKKIGSTTDDGLYGRGFYFSTNKVTADQYAKADGKTMPVYLKADNPWWSVEHKDKVAKALGMDESALTYSRSGISSTVVVPTISQAAQFSSHLAERGYGSIVVQHGSNDYEVVVFDPEQVKSADPVTYDDQGNVIPLSERFNPEQEDIRYSERDTSLPSELDLALSAADEIVAGGGDEYWASLLESDPGIAGEAEEIKRLGKQLKKTEADLAEARRNLTLTDRKLKTRGIASLAATIMQDQKAGDVNHNDVQKRITAVLTEAYQKALDQLDAGADVSDAWETVYQEGVVKATDILLTDATHSEKISYKWYTKTLGEYLGEGAREYVEDSRRAANVPSYRRGRTGSRRTSAACPYAR